MVFKFLSKIRSIYKLFITIIVYKPVFNLIGAKTIIDTPLKIVNAQNIEIGDNVTIEKYATIYSVGEYGSKTYNGKIHIGNNVYINNNCNLTAANKISIDDNVVIAANVSFFDFNHKYSDINTPVKYSDLDILGELLISKNCWIGMNVVIVGNIELGENCIVGANSVVTKSFPKNTVIAGNPAKIIKKYDDTDKRWKKVNKQGNILDEIQ